MVFDRYINDSSVATHGCLRRACGQHYTKRSPNLETVLVTLSSRIRVRCAENPFQNVDLVGEEREICEREEEACNPIRFINALVTGSTDKTPTLYQMLLSLLLVGIFLISCNMAYISGVSYLHMNT